MNILVLNYEFPPIGGGASPVSYDISRHLAQCGHRVTVVTMQYKGLEKHEIVEGIEIYRLPCIRKKSNVCHPWEQLSYIFSAILFLNRYLQSNSFDIVHTHFIIPTGAVAWYLKKKYKLPYVITAHGSDVLGHNNKRFQILYQLLRKPWCGIVKAARAVISPSVHLIDLMKKSEKNANYVYIQNGIDTDLFYSDEKQKSILIMCRLQETKGVQIVLQAISKIDMGEWKLDIVGDGPYRSALEIMAEELHISNNVVFHGWIENKSREQLQFLAQASVFVSASRVENCPVSVLEALCSGCRVLVSDIAGHREILRENGEYFSVDNAGDCARKLEKLMNEESYTLALDKKKWDWENVISQYEKVICDDRYRNG